MTYAGSLGLPRSGALIIVRSGAEPLRVHRYAFQVRRDRAADREPKLRRLLRDVIALKQAKKK